MVLKSNVLRWSVLVAVIVIAAVMVAAWTLRKPFLKKLVGNYLSTHGVTGQYHVDSLDQNHVRLSDVRIGDLSRPALRAKTITIELGWIGLSPQPRRIKLEHAIVRARVEPNGISFGALDKLIPKSTGPIVLPAVDVDVHDGLMLIETPFAPLRAHVDAHGLLSENFKAHVDVAPVTFRLKTLSVNNIHTVLDVTVLRQNFNIKEKVDADAVDFGDCSMVALTANGTGGGPDTLKEFQLNAKVLAHDVQCKGNAIQSLDLAITAHQQVDKHINGTLDVKASGMTSTPVSAHSATCIGTYDISYLPLARATGQCQMHIDDAAIAQNLLLPLTQLQASLQESAFRSVGTGHIAILNNTLQHMAIDTALAAQWHDNKATLHISKPQITGHNGGVIATSPTTTIALQYPEQRVDASGMIALSGPGLPKTELALKYFQASPQKPLHAIGNFTMPRLFLGPITSEPATIGFLYADGLRVFGHTRVSGIFKGMHFDKVFLPLDIFISNNHVIHYFPHSGCIPIQFDSLRNETMAIGTVHTRLCAMRGQPLVTRDERGNLHGGGHSDPTQLNISVAGQPAPLRLLIGSLDFNVTGKQANPILAGEFSGVGTTLATYALTISALAGSWQWSQATGLDLLQAQMRLADRTARPRFNPVILTNMNGGLHKNILTMQSDILNITQSHLAHFTLHHALDTRTGSMNIDTTGLEFTPKLQPYELSELLRGIVENVSGGLNAKALFAWTDHKITSQANVDIKNISLASAILGPVTGINGHVTFDDLINRTTPPWQGLNVASLNPGIALLDGTIRFQLLPNLHIKIENARWPFSGGILQLEPVVLVPGDAEHRVTVSIDKLDVAQFLQQMDFKDLNATGHLTGRLPMVFTQTSGRIEHGVLKAAPGGGIIQYVGNTGGAATGQAKIAFDALRDFRYNNISLEMNGDLDGDIVTAIKFSGVNQIPIKPVGRWTTGAKNVPFKFGVSIKAPFRNLIKSASSLTDARQIIREGDSATQQ